MTDGRKRRLCGLVLQVIREARPCPGYAWYWRRRRETEAACSPRDTQDVDDLAALVVAYDPGWRARFAELGGRVDAALAGVTHVTEHVGSTAVPGLDAKPIVDIDVVVPDGAAVPGAIEALAAAGWKHEGDLGIRYREAFLPPADAAYHHLYLVVAGSQPHRDHVDLRDYLRARPAQAARYGQLKRRLAPLLLTDRPAYSAGKADMIAEFLREARR